MNPAKCVFYTLFLLILVRNLSVSVQNSTADAAAIQIIKDGQLLESSRKIFVLGFFSLSNSSTTRRYVGIRYNDIPDLTIVWVANRDKPLNDNSGTFAIDSHGNLVIYTVTENISLWSINVSIPFTNDVSVQLLNSGNLIIYRRSGGILWESFDHPSDTLLPYMKIGFDRRTGFSRSLTSWKGPDDPSSGNFTIRIEPTGLPQMFLYQNNVPIWRVETWMGRGWGGVAQKASPSWAPPSFLADMTYVDNADEVSITYIADVDFVLLRATLDELGFIHNSWRLENDPRWIASLTGPTEWCDNYNWCGRNSKCDQSYADQFQCTCLPGFEPKSSHDWLVTDATAGCVRKRENAICQSGERFVEVASVKMPDTSTARTHKTINLEECEKSCLNDCNCTAYALADENMVTDIDCVTWYGDLIHMRVNVNTRNGRSLYLRVGAIELAQYTEKSHHGSARTKIVATIVVVSTVATLLLVFSLVYLWHKKQKIRKERQSSWDSPNPSELLGDQSQRASDHLHVFGLKTIIKATNDFSFHNKLGQGGFGSVYKGRLKSGKEIAVKRLAKNSGQGIGEFKNEVTLIAKLQHRNLVRILGYCLQHEEKMLVYEYLPNKSLDSFIFDESKRALLDWTKRFEIIIGIARGILYLHQDSRLKIIHRDLKACNVLLDGDLNPKIADFGLAKIFNNDQIQANTNRIVGTYGYMSPEYAMGGLFSEKSDVYSFGVLLLEIIAGRKNNSYKDGSNCINLVGKVWELWKVEKAMEVVDSSLDETKSSFENAIIKCIQIGLLCVEDDSTDRPTTSMVVFMLSNEVVLPSPKKPAFIFTSSNYKTGDPSTSANEGTSSINDVTVSMLEFR